MDLLLVFLQSGVIFILCVYYLVVEAGDWQSAARLVEELWEAELLMEVGDELLPFEIDGGWGAARLDPDDLKES